MNSTKTLRTHGFLFNFLSRFLFTLILISLPKDLYAESKLRIGVLNQVDKKWILLGLSGRNNPISSLNFSELGFDGKDMDQIDPKFLLEISKTPDETIKVFDFELSHEHHPQETLPLLISTADAQASQAQHLATSAIAALGKSIGFGIGAATAAARYPSKDYEERLRTQASYLLELIIQHEEFPALLESLSSLEAGASSSLKLARQRLFDLGGALLKRYNPKSHWAGFMVPGENRAQFFEHWMGQTQESRTHNQSLINDLANQHGLKLFHFGNVASLVYTHPKWDHEKVPIAKLFEEVSAKDKLGTQTSTNNLTTPHNKEDKELDDSLYQPSTLVAFSSRRGAVNLLDFNSPGFIARECRTRRKNLLNREIAGGFIPLSYWLIQGVQAIREHQSIQSKDPKYVGRAESYGATLALAETEILEPAPALTTSLFAYIPAVRSISASARIASIHEILALLVREEERSGYLTYQPSRSELSKIKLSYYLQLKKKLNQTPLMRVDDELSSSKHHPSRAPASLPALTSTLSPLSLSPQTQTQTHERNPIIVFMIDGLRPDRFKVALKEGLMPQLASLFYDRGTEVESFTSRSLTLPSWSTILTGYEPDVHGIRSNSPISKTEGAITDNYLDPLKDLLEAGNWKKNRAFQRLEENQIGERGKVWFPSYFKPEQTHFNYMPVVNGASLPSSPLLKNFLSNLPHYHNDAWYAATALDLASAENTAQTIASDTNAKLRLIMNWYAGADEAQHYNNRLMRVVLQDIDQAVGLVLAAAKKHPVLRNATVILISDHGHAGGFDAFSEHSPVHSFRPGPKGTLSGPLVNHTSFNLSRFFSGQHRSFEHLQFKVTTLSPADPLPNPNWMGEFQMPKPDLSFKALTDLQKPKALIDYAGSSMAQIYLKRNHHSNQSMSYYELTHFALPSRLNRLNLIEDLLTVKLPNLMISDPELHKRVVTFTQSHPTHFIAMPLRGKHDLAHLDTWGAQTETGGSTRDPVLVLSKNKEGPGVKAGIIFTRSDLEGRDWFRYVVIKNFNQDVSGHYTGTPSIEPGDDPLEYVGKVPKAEISSDWRTDREWLNLTHQHAYPTAIFTLVRTLTLSPRYDHRRTDSVLPKDVKMARRAETPDFILIANPGFGFHDHAHMESDHGGLSYEEMRNCFFISSLNPTKFKQHIEIQTPTLTRDYAVTLLDYAGLSSSTTPQATPRTQGESFKLMIDQANSTDQL